MKRSQINKIVEENITWLKEMKVNLPPFAFWTPEDWTAKGHEYDEIRENMLGWDVTDYDRGEFYNVGMLLFTIRNGNLKNKQFAKPYAEKAIILEIDQLCPIHYHWTKTEDIINRGGGILMLQLWNATETDELDLNSDVHVRIDGKVTVLPPGGKVYLQPGESITISPKQYHLFTAKESKVLAWEVSTVNDDNIDNCFYEKQARFSKIDEDEPAKYLLCNEYPNAK